MSKVIKKNSKGYGYEYASLSDLVEQGCEIPRTKIELEDGKQFLWFYDTELKEWLRGAEIVMPEMAKSNAAQKYGAALTYAFRYVTQMFNRVATGDDALIEEIDEKGEKKSAKKEAPADPKQTEELRKQMFAGEEKPLTQAEKAWLIRTYKIKSDKDITPEMVAELRKLQEAKRNANSKAA